MTMCASAPGTDELNLELMRRLLGGLDQLRTSPRLMNPKLN